MIIDPINSTKSSHATQKCGFQYDCNLVTPNGETDVAFYLKLNRQYREWDDSTRVKINTDKGQRYAY